MTDEIWIDARHALVRAAGVFKGIAVGKVELSERLRLGLLRTRAGRMTESSDGGSFQWKQHPPKIPAAAGRRIIVPALGAKQDVFDTEIPTALWASSIESIDDQRRWRWDVGNFVITSRHDSALQNWTRIQAFGVKFLLGEIEGLGSTDLPVLTRRASHSETEEREHIPTWDWDGALIELMMFADRDGLVETFGDFEFRGASSKIADFFAAYFRKTRDREPSPSARNKRAAAIITAWKRQKRLGLDQDLLKSFNKI